MGIEIKLAAGCILALVIGVLAISPLMLSTLRTSKAENTPAPFFDMNIPYVYIGFGNSSNLGVGGRDFCIVFNATSNVNENDDLPDAAIEYFQIQIYSNHGQIESLTEYTGTAYNSSFTPQTFNSFIFNRDQWFDTRASGGGGGIFRFNWTANQSQLNMLTGSTNSQPNYQDAETIFIDVRRIGTIIFSGNSTIASIANAESIEHLELQKYENGFLYNTLVPADQLAQMDPLKPTFGEQP